jgi:hypothetical protein
MKILRKLIAFFVDVCVHPYASKSASRDSISCSPQVQSLRRPTPSASLQNRIGRFRIRSILPKKSQYGTGNRRDPLSDETKTDVCNKQQVSEES